MSFSKTQCSKSRGGLTITVACLLALSINSICNVSGTVIGPCDVIGPPKNVTKDDLSPYGNCVPYKEATLVGVCDEFFQIGIDYVYVPNKRTNGSLETLNHFIEQVANIKGLLTEPCKTPGLESICLHYYPHCGNMTHFVPPVSICGDTCSAIIAGICKTEFKLINSYIGDEEVQLGLALPNCTNPGEFIDPLPHCCVDVSLPHTAEPSETSNKSSHVLLSAIGGGVGAFLVLAVTVGVVCGCVWRSRRGHRRQLVNQATMVLEKRDTSETVPDTKEGSYFFGDAAIDPAQVSAHSQVSPEYMNFMKESSLLIPWEHFQLMDIVGKGEFATVYRAHMSGWRNQANEVVAVKTMRGTLFTPRDIEDMMQESIKMKKLDHPNVLGLIGVTVAAGNPPYIVMPYMANGSLLSFLRRERANLTSANDAEDTERLLLSMCLQVARGMEYLAQEMFVHRDLAARNCMIDENLVIKVADFGLLEDVYSRNYFRQEKEGGVKLPVKWMALESLLDGIFAEKTDVWSFGVTCWEMFSLGKTPYPGMEPLAVIKYLEREERLEKPSGAACSDETYEIMLRCWESDPKKRPSFAELVVSITSALEDIAGYLDLSAITSFRNASTISCGLQDSAQAVNDDA